MTLETLEREGVTINEPILFYNEFIDWLKPDPKIKLGISLDDDAVAIENKYHDFLFNVKKLDESKISPKLDDFRIKWDESSSFRQELLEKMEQASIKDTKSNNEGNETPEERHSRLMAQHYPPQPKLTRRQEIKKRPSVIEEHN